MIITWSNLLVLLSLYVKQFGCIGLHFINKSVTSHTLDNFFVSTITILLFINSYVVWVAILGVVQESTHGLDIFITWNLGLKTNLIFCNAQSAPFIVLKSSVVMVRNLLFSFISMVYSSQKCAVPFSWRMRVILSSWPSEFISNENDYENDSDWIDYCFL